MVGGEGDKQFWGSGPGAIAGCYGAIAGCHCSVLYLGASAITNFGGMDMVPLLGVHGTLHSNGMQKKHPEKLP